MFIRVLVAQKILNIAAFTATLIQMMIVIFIFFIMINAILEISTLRVQWERHLVLIQFTSSKVRIHNILHKVPTNSVPMFMRGYKALMGTFWTL